MGVEIERKFLVNKKKWNKPDNGCLYTQAYLAKEGCTLRVRIAETKAFITIKGPTVGCSRKEFEYEIPIADAQDMMKLALYQPIVKIRYKQEIGGKIWEIDEFLDSNEGLIVAEIELNSEQESFIMPEWVDQEVTSDKRYTNASLSKHPYKAW
ncbi:MAG: CYTH domain protein [Bacteroidetes bacterium ADurb.Bin302]|nr:MAG: CYTH domain protein [Bacteroidetes bacterium ADurb.Bin302]